MNSLDNARTTIQYKWYDYVIVYSGLIVVSCTLFWLFITAAILLFGD